MARLPSPVSRPLRGAIAAEVAGVEANFTNPAGLLALLRATRLATPPEGLVRRSAARGVLGVVLGLLIRGPLWLGRRLRLGLRCCWRLGLRHGLSHRFCLALGNLLNVDRAGVVSDGHGTRLEEIEVRRGPGICCGAVVGVGRGRFVVEASVYALRNLSLSLHIGRGHLRMDS